MEGSNKMKKFNFKNFFSKFSNNKLTIFMSVLFAIILWILTIMFNTDSYSVVKISGVPIVTNLSNTQADQLGLSIVNIIPKNVSVYVKGPRNKIVFIKKEDIIATPKTYSSIGYSGSYNLEISAYLKNPQQNVTIERISNKNAVFVVDIMETKLVKVVSDEIEVEVADGYIKDKNVCQPGNLFVTGPKQSIDKLDHIKLFVEKGLNVLNSSKTFNAMAKFISTTGGVIDSSVFKYDSDVKFNVTIPVYKVKKLPLKILYKNIPEGFNVDVLKPKIEPSFVEVAGKEDLVKNLNEIHLGYVDLKELTDKKTSFSFNLTLEPGLKNLNQVSSVDVNFNKEKLGHRIFNVKGIDLINIPKDCEVTTNSNTIKNVKIVGYKEHLKNLSSSNLTATVDCSNVSRKIGMQNVSVNVGIIKRNGIFWPVGENSCLITVKKK